MSELKTQRGLITNGLLVTTLVAMGVCFIFYKPYALYLVGASLTALAFRLNELRKSVNDRKEINQMNKLRKSMFRFDWCNRNKLI